MSIKFCYTALRLFNQILDNQPMMTGCYQWIRAFKGDAINYHSLEDPEKYDVIMVNGDGQDVRLIPELHHRLRGSSTKIVLNSDYSTEMINEGFSLWVDLRNAINLADHVFTTTPTSQAAFTPFTDKPIWLSPHPCETHILKHFASSIENDWCIIYYHRYANETFIPYAALHKLGMKFGLIGYQPEHDQFSRRTLSDYPVILRSIDFMNFMKIIKEARYGLMVGPSYTWARNVCDSAALNRPMVASKNFYAAQICYPLTLVDPYNITEIRNMLTKLRDNDGFYDEVCSIAQYNVEHFGHEACRQRFMAMIEEPDNSKKTGEDDDKKTI